MSAIVTSFHQIDIEPVKTVNPAVDDLPHVNESKPEDDEKIPENGKFAELLAGLLRNSPANGAAHETVEQIQNAGEDASIGSASELIPVIPEIDPALEAIAASSIFGIEEQSLLNKLSIDALQDNQLADNDENLLGAKELLSDIETASKMRALGVNEGDHLNDIPVFTEADIMQEAELEEDFFELNLKNNSDIDALQALAAQEAEAAAERNRAQKSQDNSQNISDLAINSESDTDEKSLRTRAEKDNPVISEDMRAQERSKGRRGRASLEVNDMRAGLQDANKSGGSLASIEAGAGRAAAGGDPAIREMTLELRLPESVAEQSRAINQANISWEAKAGSAVENLLARELHQNFNGDIVRHASVLLKDGDNAVIRLALKPETLGNVKIALELSDNKITGKILVESEEALNAFRKEIASLEQQFKDSGFAEANLNLSLTSDNQNMEGWNESEIVPPVFASRYEDTAEQKTLNLVNVYFGHGKGRVNLLV